MMDHLKSKLRRKPTNIILHCETNNITDGVNNPVKKVKSFVKEITDFNKDVNTNIAVSGTLQRAGSKMREKVKKIN